MGAVTAQPSPALQVPAGGTRGHVTPPPAPAPPSSPGTSSSVTSVRLAPLLMTADLGAESASPVLRGQLGLWPDCCCRPLYSRPSPGLAPTVHPQYCWWQSHWFPGRKGEGRDERKNKDTALCLHLRHPVSPKLPPPPLVALYLLWPEKRSRPAISVPLCR